MEGLILKNNTWYDNLSDKERDTLKLEYPDIESDTPRRGDVIEVHEDGYFTATNRINGFGKNDYILFIAKGVSIDKTLLYADYLDTDVLKIKSTKYRKYFVDIDKVKVTDKTTDTKSVETINITDIKALCVTLSKAKVVAVTTKVVK